MFATLLQNVTAPGEGADILNEPHMKTYQASGVTTAGAGAAVVAVQGQVDPAGAWDTIGEISLTLGTTRSSDSFTSDDRYQRIRGRVVSISGTGASVNLVMGA